MRQARKHPRTVRVWPMGVDVDRFGPHRRSAEWRQALLDRVGGTESSRLLVYAGRLSSEKNVLLLVAGAGPLADALADECSRRAPARTTFLWHLGREALADVLANADAFVTTYASDETAWLAPADPESFAGRIQEIFADPDGRARKTERAMEVARSYAWERVAGQFFQTYEQLVRMATAT